MYVDRAQGKLSILQAYRMEKLFHSMRSANSSADYEFSSVDKLFVSQRLPLQKCVADVFKDEVHKMDFVLDPELARMYINNWVANQTNGQIKDLIPTSIITHTTRLVLVRRTAVAAEPGIHPLSRVSGRKGRGRFLLDVPAYDRPVTVPTLGFAGEVFARTPIKSS